MSHRHPFITVLTAVTITAVGALPAHAGPPPIVEPTPPSGSSTSGGSDYGWLDAAAQIGSAVLVLAGLLLVIGYFTSRHAGRRVSTVT